MDRRHYFPCLLLILGLGAQPPARADEEALKLSAEQVKSMALVAQPLADFATGGERRLPAQAVVPPRQVKVLAAPLAGLVASMEVAYGETVRKGQALARLQSSDALTLQKEYLQARSQARLAGENLQRDRALFSEGIIAGGRLAATEGADREAAALLMEKRQALKLAGLGEPSPNAISGTVEITAPFDGVVLDAPVQPGQRVDANTALFRLGRLRPLWLEIQATSAQAAGLAPGDAVSIPGCPDKGKLTLVAPALTPGSQSLLLRAEIASPSDCLKPFQYTQADITPARRGQGWRLPATALTRHQARTWVFVEAPGGYRPVPVEVREEGEKTTLVTADLPPQSKVVVRGLAALKAVWLGLGGANP